MVTLINNNKTTDSSAKINITKEGIFEATEE